MFLLTYLLTYQESYGFVDVSLVYVLVS